jgi:hypothetical protein
MQIHNTVLAIQMMNGLKVYAVAFDGSKTYSYKTFDTFEVHDIVLVPVERSGTTAFAIARVVCEVELVDFDSDIQLKYINQRLENPYDLNSALNAQDQSAKSKIAAAQVQKAAQEYLTAAGLKASDFAQISAPADKGEK